MDNIIPQDTSLKQCKGVCGRFLPATTDYFHHNPQQKSKLHPHCKECRNAEKKAIYAKPEEKEKARQRSKQYRDANKEHLNARAKDYYETHKEQAKEWQQANREHRKVYNKAWYKANQDHVIQYRKERYVTHAEYYREYTKQYIKANPIKNRQNVHKYKARKRGNGGKYTPAQIEEQMNRQKHKCYYAACGHAKFKQVNGKYIYHIDHVVPLSRGGTNDIFNIVLACPSCNDRKHNKLPHEWPEGGRLF